MCPTQGAAGGIPNQDPLVWRERFYRRNFRGSNFHQQHRSWRAAGPPAAMSLTSGCTGRAASQTHRTQRPPPRAPSQQPGFQHHWGRGLDFQPLGALRQAPAGLPRVSGPLPALQPSPHPRPSSLETGTGSPHPFGLSTDPAPPVDTTSSASAMRWVPGCARPLWAQGGVASPVRLLGLCLRTPSTWKPDPGARGPASHGTCILRLM